MPAPQDRVSLSSRPVMVAIGDSLTAGMMDAMQDARRQGHGYVPLVAAAAGIPMNLPLITHGTVPPGYWTGSAFDLKHVGEMMDQITKKVGPLAAYLEYVGMPDDFSPIWSLPGMGHRDPDSRDTPQHPQGNFAVAGFEMRHLTDVKSYRDYAEEIHELISDRSGLVTEVPGTRELLQNGTEAVRGSEVDQAIRRNPDLIVFWGGANDALAPAFDGVIDDSTLTPVADQIWDFWHQDLLTKQWARHQTDHPIKGFYHALLGSDGAIPRLLRETHAEIVIMTLPEIAAIPFLREVGKPVGRLPFRVVLKDGTDVTERLENFVIPDQVVGPGNDGRTRFPPGSKVNLLSLLSKVVESSEHGQIETRADMEAAMQHITQQGAFTEWDVLDPDEIARTDDRIEEFNEVIARAAQNPRVHLLDMHAIFDEIRTKGRLLRGSGPAVRVTSTFTGAPTANGDDGIFSFDGVHPSDTGHAVLANLVLDKIKQDLGDRPKFACFKNAKPIDERAVWRSDPHRTGERPPLLLAPEAIAALAPLGMPAVTSMIAKEQRAMIAAKK